MAFERPESFKTTKLTSSLAKAGAESTLTVPSAQAPNETTGFLVVKQGEGNDAQKEIISYTGVSGGTITIGERGLPEYTTTGTALSKTGLTANKLKFSPGATVELANTHWYLGQVIDWANGLTGSGAVSLQIGLGTDVDISLYARNGDANKPFLMYDASANAWVKSDNGVDTVIIGSDSASWTGGDGIVITASDIGVDLATDPGLEISSTKLRAKIKSPTAGYLTGGSSATTTIATWTAVNDGSLVISINNTAYSLTSIDFSSGVTTMANVATKIQTALRTATSSTETVAWSTDHFIITSATTGANSRVSVASAVGSGTDISGAGATAFMDCDTGHGTPTDGTGAGLTRDSNGLSITQSEAFDFTGKCNFTQIHLNDVVLTSSATELNRLTGISANVTATNLGLLTGGTDTTLHGHNRLLGQNIDGTSICYPLDLANFSNNQGGITNAGGFGAFFESTGAAWYSAASIIADKDGGTGTYLLFGTGDITYEFRAMFATGVTGDRRMGLGSNSGSDFALAYNNNTQDGIYFGADGGTLYAVTVLGGTGVTATDISSGITLTQWHTYKIVYDTGVSAKFYVDNVLKATHTTNLPVAGDSVYAGYGGETNTEDLYFACPLIIIEI